MKKKRRILPIISILSLITLGFVMLSIFDFYMILQNNENKIQSNFIEDIARQNSTITDIKLTSYLNTLYGIARYISNNQINIPETVKGFRKIISKEEFDGLGFVSTDGIVLSTNGIDEIQFSISDRSYWQTLLQKQHVITEVYFSTITHKRIFFVAVPVLDENKNFKGAIHASILVSDFQNYIGKKLGLSNYNVFLIDKQGEYVTKCNRKNAQSYENFFDFFTDHGRKLNIEELKANIQIEKTFTKDVYIDKEDYIACFTPLEQNNWYTVVTISQNDIHKQVSKLVDYNLYILIAKLLIAFGFLSVLITYITRKEEIKQRNQEIQVQEKLFSDIDGIVQADLEKNKIIYISNNFKVRKLDKISYSDLIEEYIKNRVDEKYHKKLLDATQINNLLTLQSQGINRISLEYLILNKNEKIWNQCEIHIDTDAKTGHACVYYIIKNIDDKKRREQALKVRAETDELTGLYNRSTGTSLINQFLALNNYTEETSAFLILDLDNFKEVNDTLLHKTGDKALQDVAKIISSTFRKNDIVFRLGGDEFIIFMKNIKGSIVEEKSKSLVNQLQLTYSNNSKEVSISASIGISLFPKDGSTFSKLYTKADSALYKAKKSGKSTFCYYEHEEHES